MRDLVETAVREGLVAVGAAGADGWSSVGAVRARFDRGLPPRLVPGAEPVVEPADPVAVLDALGLEGAGRAQLRDDLADAVAHGAALDAALDAVPGTDRVDPAREAERRTASRGRPFHPTARAVSGWSAVDVAAYGPARPDPLPLAWVAVHADHLRDGVRGLPPEAVAGDADGAAVRAAMRERGLHGHRPLPVHPWQAAHVLPAVFAEEIAASVVVPLGPAAHGLGSGRPTASWRTLDLGDGRHLKLPLGVATLGATRLLPARYLDNADRGEALLRRVLAADEHLAATVTVAGEGTWTGFARPGGHDEFDDRPGHLAAALRTLPAGALPLGGLAPIDEYAHRELATAFLTMGLGFLRHGVLPELHGQNVLVRGDAAPPGTRRPGPRFVLRDHDTVRVHRPWAERAGVGDPGYRITPGARQSLLLDDPAELVGYLCTLGLQVTLGGLAHHHGLSPAAAAGAWRAGLDAALETVELPDEVREVVVAVLLRAPRWPHRTVLGPLLARGRSAGVSMPAATGSVPNPLHEPGYAPVPRS